MPLSPVSSTRLVWQEFAGDLRDNLPHRARIDLIP
jgi:hypothetical protein